MKNRTMMVILFVLSLTMKAQQHPSFSHKGMLSLYETWDLLFLCKRKTIGMEDVATDIVCASSHFPVLVAFFFLSLVVFTLYTCFFSAGFNEMRCNGVCFRLLQFVVWKLACFVIAHPVCNEILSHICYSWALVFSWFLVTIHCTCTDVDYWLVERK